MSEERRDSSGGPAAVVVILVAIALLAVAVVGGGGAIAYLRVNNAQQVEMMEKRAWAEMMAVQMAQERAVLESELRRTKDEQQLQQSQASAAMSLAKAATNPHEIVLEIDAAGKFQFAGKTLENIEELQAEFAAQRLTWGVDLRLVVSADKDVKFEQLTKVIETAETVKISSHRILTPTSPRPATGAPVQP